MQSNGLLSLLLVPTFIIVGGCQSSPVESVLPAPHESSASGAYHHKMSGFVFPTEILHFNRINLTQFDKEGLDISAGYRDAGLRKPIEITAYLYPGPHLTSIASPANVIQQAREHLCQDAFRASKEEVLHAHKNALIINHESGVSSASMATGPQEALFSYEGEGVQSLLMMVCPYRGTWILKIRATYPAAFDGKKEASLFTEEILKRNN